MKALRTCSSIKYRLYGGLKRRHSANAGRATMGDVITASRSSIPGGGSAAATSTRSVFGMTALAIGPQPTTNPFSGSCFGRRPQATVAPLQVAYRKAAIAYRIFA
jgi:hypothetical protein